MARADRGSHGRTWVRRNQTEHTMAWTTPVIEEICLGMEVTSYESAEIEF